MASPPGPVLQKINAALHTEPLSTIVYGLYWCFFFLLVTPFTVLFLQIQIVVRLLFFWTGMTKENYYDPSKHVDEQELAIVITGCDSGFGKEIAFWAAEKGFYVFAGCLNEKSFAQFAQSPTVIPVHMNVTSDKDVSQVVEKVSSWLKEGTKKKRVLHALINNAGIGRGGEIDWTDLSEFQNVMDVNFFGMVRCCKAFLPLLKEQAIQRKHEDARIFNMVSMAGMVPPAVAMAAYSASKHAAYAFSSSLRIELKAFGIQVCTINPSFHGTPLVMGMANLADSTHADLPETTKQEYGEDFFKHYKYLSANVPQMVTWKLDVVIELVMRVLMMKHAPPEMIIGTDARLFLVVLRMLPAWCLDFLNELNPRPIPAVMEQK